MPYQNVKKQKRKFLSCFDVLSVSRHGSFSRVLDFFTLVSLHCLMMRNRFKLEITLTLAEVYDMQTQMG